MRELGYAIHMARNIQETAKRFCWVQRDWQLMGSQIDYMLSNQTDIFPFDELVESQKLVQRMLRQFLRKNQKMAFTATVLKTKDKITANRL